MGVSSHWYNEGYGADLQFDADGYGYTYHIPPGAPVPSKADYDAGNVAWLGDFFNEICGFSGPVNLIYHNNTPDNTSNWITVPCSGGGGDLEAKREELATTPKSNELRHYEERAKQSAILKNYMQNSPAAWLVPEYFHDLEYPGG